MSSALTASAPSPLSSAAFAASAPLTASRLAQAHPPSLSGDTPIPSPPSSISGHTHVGSIHKGEDEDDLEKAERKEEEAAVLAAPAFPEGGTRAYLAVAGATIIMATTFGMSNSL